MSENVHMHTVTAFLRKIMLLPSEHVLEYQQVRVEELKTGLKILFWFLLCAHLIAHITIPSDMHPEQFLKYRIISIGGYLFLCIYIIKFKKIMGLRTDIVLYLFFYIDLLFPFIIGAMDHPFRLLGIAQVAFFINFF